MCGFVRELDIREEENQRLSEIERIAASRGYVRGFQAGLDQLTKSIADAEARRPIQILFNIDDPVRQEYKQFAKKVASALVLALQSDYAEVDKLAREVRFDFTKDGEPTIKSFALDLYA